MYNTFLCSIRNIYSGKLLNCQNYYLKPSRIIHIETTIHRIWQDLILCTPSIHAFISVKIVRLITVTQFFFLHSVLSLSGSGRVPGTSPQLLVNSFNQGSWHSALLLAGAVILFRARRRGNRMSATWDFHSCQYTHRSAQHSRVLTQADPSFPVL